MKRNLEGAKRTCKHILQLFLQASFVPVRPNLFSAIAYYLFDNMQASRSVEHMKTATTFTHPEIVIGLAEARFTAQTLQKRLQEMADADSGEDLDWQEVTA